MEFINIGPAYIRRWQEGCGSEVVAKLKQRSKKTKIVEFRVIMM